MGPGPVRPPPGGLGPKPARLSPAQRQKPLRGLGDPVKFSEGIKTSEQPSGCSCPPPLPPPPPPPAAGRLSPSLPPMLRGEGGRGGSACSPLAFLIIIFLLLIFLLIIIFLLLSLGDGQREGAGGASPEVREGFHAPLNFFPLTPMLLFAGS